MRLSFCDRGQYAICSAVSKSALVSVIKSSRVGVSRLATRSLWAAMSFSKRFRTSRPLAKLAGRVWYRLLKNSGRKFFSS